VGVKFNVSFRGKKIDGGHLRTKKRYFGLRSSIIAGLMAKKQLSLGQHISLVD
jgi:hypothetical protein